MKLDGGGSSPWRSSRPSLPPSAGGASSAGRMAKRGRGTAASRRRRISTRSRADRPAAFVSKDYHSLWLNSAALALAGGDLEVDGGVVERDAGGGPTGSCARSRRGGSKTGTRASRRTSSRRDARRREARARARCHVRPRQGRLARRSGALAAARRAEAELRVWQSVPARQAAGAAFTRDRSGVGSPMLRLGYLKVFMDGTLGSRTALMLDGSGVRDHEPRGARGDRPGGAEAGGPSPCTRSATREPQGARRVRDDPAVWEPRGLRHRIEHAQCLDAGRHTSFRAARRRRLGAVHARAVRRASSRSGSGPTGSTGTYSFRSLLDSGALRRERLGRAGRGARPVGRRRRRRPAHATWREDQRAHARAGAARDVRRAGVALARRARRAARSSPAGSPTSSSLDRDPFACDPGRATRRAGGGDDARRPLGAQPAALGLAAGSR